MSNAPECPAGLKGKVAELLAAMPAAEALPEELAVDVGGGMTAPEGASGPDAAGVVARRPGRPGRPVAAAGART